MGTLNVRFGGISDHHRLACGHRKGTWLPWPAGYSGATAREGNWPTEYVPAKRDKARRRMRLVLDARPDLARAAEEYAARRSAVARMGIAVPCRADA